ncbi:MAG: DegT/DnrJ/EryC1/StrS family aminotransferase [Phycisphaeraceae bacterium]
MSTASITIDQDLLREPLALQGGAAAMPDPERDAELFHWPIVTEEDEQAVLDVMRRGTMSATDITKQFEAEFAEWLGTAHALGTCNGTAALLAAFWACGIGAGDEIICPSITYWASAAPALSLGATVSFADIDPDTLCIDPNDIAHRIGERTKAIVVVHYSGHPADMDAINAIARQHNVKVIEDVSHAQGSRYKGRLCGTLGDIGAMSMMAGKSFAIGEAGMLVTNDRTLYERAVAFGHYERTGGPSMYARSEQAVHGELKKFSGLPIGAVKHRMNQTCSAMGRVQLRHYEARITEIQRAMNRFWDLLEDTPGLRAHRPGDADSTMGGWYNARGLYRAEELGGLPCATFCEAVRAEGVKVCTPGANFPLHLHPVFHELDLFHQGQPTALAFGQRDVRQGEGTLSNAERIREITFSVPWFKHDQPERIARYAAAYKKVAQQAASLR